MRAGTHGRSSCHSCCECCGSVRSALANGCPQSLKLGAWPCLMLAVECPVCPLIENVLELCGTAPMPCSADFPDDSSCVLKFVIKLISLVSLLSVWLPWAG